MLTCKTVLLSRDGGLLVNSSNLLRAVTPGQVQQHTRAHTHTLTYTLAHTHTHSMLCSTKGWSVWVEPASTFSVWNMCQLMLNMITIYIHKQQKKIYNALNISKCTASVQNNDGDKTVCELMV